MPSIYDVAPIVNDWMRVQYCKDAEAERLDQERLRDILRHNRDGIRQTLCEIWYYWRNGRDSCSMPPDDVSRIYARGEPGIDFYEDLDEYDDALLMGWNNHYPEPDWKRVYDLHNINDRSTVTKFVLRMLWYQGDVVTLCDEWGDSECHGGYWSCKMPPQQPTELMLHHSSASLGDDKCYAAYQKLQAQQRLRRSAVYWLHFDEREGHVDSCYFHIGAMLTDSDDDNDDDCYLYTNKLHWTLNECLSYEFFGMTYLVCLTYCGFWYIAIVWDPAKFGATDCVLVLNSADMQTLHNNNTTLLKKLEDFVTHHGSEFMHLRNTNTTLRTTVTLLKDKLRFMLAFFQGNSSNSDIDASLLAMHAELDTLDVV